MDKLKTKEYVDPFKGSKESVSLGLNIAKISPIMPL